MMMMMEAPSMLFLPANGLVNRTCQARRLVPPYRLITHFHAQGDWSHTLTCRGLRQPPFKYFRMAEHKLLKLRRRSFRDGPQATALWNNRPRTTATMLLGLGGLANDVASQRSLSHPIPQIEREKARFSSFSHLMMTSHCLNRCNAVLRTGTYPRTSSEAGSTNIRFTGADFVTSVRRCCVAWTAW